MDNLAIWIVILILAYAVYRLWDSKVKDLREHVKHIEDLEWKVKNQTEDIEWLEKDIERLDKSKADKVD